MSATIDRLVEVSRQYGADRGEADEEMIGPASAVCQDLLIFGIDVDDYVAVLRQSFGDVVLEVPWLRFTDQTASFRGYGCVAFPFWWAWRVLRFVFKGGPILPRPDPRAHPERLTLAHLARVIDAGKWIEPKQTLP